MKKAARGGLAVVLLFLAARHFLGYYYFSRYEKIRGGARSIEKNLPALENNLKRAVRFSKNPEFYKELGRLYLERAMGENQFGTPERRDFYCDRAVEALREQIERDPADAEGYYQAGLVFLLYNYPLMTYRERARIYLRRAVELHPADEFIGMNVCAIFLTQWGELNEQEKQIVRQRLKRDRYEKTAFFKKIREKVIESLGSAERFKEVLEQDPALREVAKKYFQ